MHLYVLCSFILNNKKKCVFQKDTSKRVGYLFYFINQMNFVPLYQQQLRQKIINHFVRHRVLIYMSGEFNSIRSKTLFHAFQNVNKKNTYH